MRDRALHGTLGVLHTDGGRVQCHACGRCFKAAGTHLVRKHGITADEYRRMFGLRKTTGFVSARIKDLMRQTAVERLSPYWGRGLTSAGGVGSGHHTGPSLETRDRGHGQRVAREGFGDYGQSHVAIVIGRLCRGEACGVTGGAT